MIKLETKIPPGGPNGPPEEPEVVTRSRSSSRTKSNYNPTVSQEQQQALLRNEDLKTFQHQVPPLNRLVWVVKLKSLNQTFEPKTLVVPRAPETVKLGRPGGSKIQSKTTNGFFDSRVLSRNHAELFIDSKKSALYIRDLKSSNGTYINGKQVEPFKNYDLKIGDKFDLGSNLENQTAHKKISCEVTDLLIMSLKEYEDSIYKLDQERQINGKEFFHNAIDALIYGDVVNDMYEDNVLSLLSTTSKDLAKLDQNYSISGLYPSSNIKNNTKLEETVSQLLLILNNEFLQNEKLNKIHKFLINYNQGLDKFQNSVNDSHQIQPELDSYTTKIRESDLKIEELNHKVELLTKEIGIQESVNTKTKQEFKNRMMLKNEEIELYKLQLELLNTKYDNLVKEKELIINFQVKDTENGHEYKEEDEEEDEEEGIKESESTGITTIVKEPKSYRPNLFQTGIILVASVLAGVAYYQKT